MLGQHATASCMARGACGGRTVIYVVCSGECTVQHPRLIKCLIIACPRLHTRILPWQNWQAECSPRCRMELRFGSLSLQLSAPALGAPGLPSPGAHLCDSPSVCSGATLGKLSNAQCAKHAAGGRTEGAPCRCMAQQQQGDILGTSGREVLGTQLQADMWQACIVASGALGSCKRPRLLPGWWPEAAHKLTHTRHFKRPLQNPPLTVSDPRSGLHQRTCAVLCPSHPAPCPHPTSSQEAGQPASDMLGGQGTTSVKARSGCLSFQCHLIMWQVCHASMPSLLILGTDFVLWHPMLDKAVLLWTA